MDIGNFREMYKTELQEACSMEAQLVKALAKMAESAHDTQLKQAIQSHLEETRDHHQKMEQAVQRHGLKPREHTDQAMQAMIREAEKWAGMVRDPAARDAGLIASAQRIEHYEVAVYGTLATWAKQCGLEEDERMLHAILEQEKKADDKLTRLAKATVNPHAMQKAA